LKRIAVIGSLNIDHVLRTKSLPSRGETIISESYQLKCGGKGANQAAAIGRLEVSVHMIGKVGDDEAGTMQIKSLEKSGVNTDGIIIDKEQKTGAAFITVDNKGNNTIVLFSGTNGLLGKNDVDQKKYLILDSDAVVLQMEVPVETTCHVIRFAHENNKKIILSLAPAIEIDRSVLGMVDFLMVNEVEIKFLSGVEFNIEDISNSIIKLRKFFKNNIVITLGEMGSLLVDRKENIYRSMAYKVNAVDSTAAGDAFTGGFIMGLTEGLSLPDCMEIGNAAGAISVTRLGAQPSLPFRDDLVKFLVKNNSKINL
jgi:ribokinase